MDVIVRASAATMQLLSASALWLVLSFGVGGLIREFVPMEWMNRHLGHKGIMPVVYASIGGAIIPAWCCGIIPVGVQLYQMGASLGVVLAFILAGTVINPAVVPMATVMLGPELTAAYVATAIIGPIIVGLTANIFGGSNVLGQHGSSHIDLHRAELAAGAAETIDLVDLDELEPPGLWERLRAAFKWGFQDLAVGMSVYLILGFGLAGLASSVISCNPSAALGRFFGEPGLLPLLATAGISSIVYIWTYASVPLAASLVAFGLVPGAAIVMLVVGAATNIPGLLLILRYMGRRAAVIFPLAASVIALTAGYLVDLWIPPKLALRSIMGTAALGGIGSGGGEILYDAWGWPIIPTLGQAGSGAMTPEKLFFTMTSAVSLACLIFFGLLMLYGLYRQARSHLLPLITRSP